MESYERKSDEAESQADRLEDEGERVARRIEETKSEVQSKEGQVLGVAGPSDDDEEGASADESEEATDEGE